MNERGDSLVATLLSIWLLVLLAWLAAQ